METNVHIVLLASLCVGIALQIIGVKLSQRPIGTGHAKSSFFMTMVLVAIITLLMLAIERFIPAPWSYPLWLILCLWMAAASAALPGIFWDIARGR